LAKRAPCMCSLRPRAFATSATARISSPALLIEALDEPVTATIHGERREITKREAVVTQLVYKSTAADLRATKMLVDMLRKRRSVAAPPPPAAFMPADEEVTATFIARLCQSEEELR
jgi:Family of unknown function (DUF5681)